MGFYAALALLPDADVIGFALGVRYADPWGHRGATHSLLFALLVALLVAGVARALRGPALRTGLLALLAVGSHGLLDTFTDGGLGAALLWPFRETRYFAPWHPLPVAPIGAGMLSSRGLYVLAVELVAFLPLWTVALLPRRGGT
jgi:inner membrane protein